jgi:hypothetical protein
MVTHPPCDFRKITPLNAGISGAVNVMNDAGFASDTVPKKDSAS